MYLCTVTIMQICKNKVLMLSSLNALNADIVLPNSVENIKGRTVKTGH